MAALLLLAAGGPCAIAQSESAAAPSELAQQLRELEQQVAQTKPHAPLALPSGWRVHTPDGDHSISTEPLRRYLAVSNRESAAVWLEEVARQLDGWRSPQGPTATRSKLNQILDRREFARAGPPGPLELLRQRIVAWIDDMIARFLALIGRHPGTSRAIFWVLVAGAAAVLVAWLIRLGRREGTFLALRGAGPLLPSHDVEEWIAWAHQAASRGDLRQAIHCAYWAGVVQLQQGGVLAGGRVLTPREYLRLSRKSHAVAGPAQAEHLAALTTSLERFWYADRAASADDFRESLRHLEGLGCRVA